MKRAAIALALVLSLAGIHAAGASQSTDGWTRYHITTTTGTGDAEVRTIWVSTKCLNAEDSAAHLKLVGYDGGIARYRCYHSGY